MLNDLTIQFYAEAAQIELSKNEKWMRISPRLALEVFQELQRLRGTDVPAQAAALATARHNEDIQKS